MELTVNSIPTFLSSSSMAILGSPTLLLFSPASRIPSKFYFGITALWVPPTAGRGLDHRRRLAPPKVYWSSAKAATWLSHGGAWVRPSPPYSLTASPTQGKLKTWEKWQNIERAGTQAGYTWSGKACFAFDHLLLAYVTLTAITRKISRSWQLRGKKI